MDAWFDHIVFHSMDGVQPFIGWGVQHPLAAVALGVGGYALLVGLLVWSGRSIKLK